MSQTSALLKRIRSLETECDRMAGIIGEQEVEIIDLRQQLVTFRALGDDLSAIVTFQASQRGKPLRIS